MFLTKQRLGFKQLIFLFSLLAASANFALAKKLEEQTFINLGTGGLTGVYYPAGGAICSLVNKTSKEHQLRCSAETSRGSEYNLQAIQEGEFDFALVQSDVQFNAYKHQEQFASTNFSNLRSVFSLHTESLTLVARQETNAKKFTDLQGRKINLGNEGSGQRATIDLLLKTMQTDASFFAEATNLRAADMANALCSGKVDAINYVVGHPNSSIKEATSNCKSKILAVDQDLTTKILAEHPYYIPAVIPGNEYPNNPDPVATFGVVATFVTHAETSNEVVYQLVKSVFDNFDAFKQRHPAFANLNKQAMTNQGLTAPLHPGAKKYFIEAGLLAD